LNISGNTVLVTGGATGIGLALAAELVRRGNEVIICGRRQDRLDRAKEQIPQLHTRTADVADAASRRALVEWLRSQHPKLNVLVNNAGIQHLFSFTAGERDLARADEEVAINLLAPIHLAAELIPHLSRQPAAAIVNVSSGLGFAPLAHMPVYCATKAAMHSLTMSLRHQLRGTSVRTFEVIPPIVASELGSAHRPAQMNATAMPAETAALEIVEGLERDQFEIAIGDAAGLMAKRDAAFPFMNR
jgi:uncharacterized oxidoreductase